MRDELDGIKKLDSVSDRVAEHNARILHEVKTQNLFDISRCHVVCLVVKTCFELTSSELSQCHGTRCSNYGSIFEGKSFGALYGANGTGIPPL